MEHEIIDLLNNDGKIIGKVDKAEAHKKGLWHKSVHLWIFNQAGDVLLQKRCAEKKFFPNFWDVSVAGHIGANESSINTAIREAEEEIGIDILANKLQFAFTFKEQLVWKDIISNEFIDVFVAIKNLDTNQLSFQKEEVEDAKFFKVDTIFGSDLKKDIFPHYEEYKLLKKFLNNFNKRGEDL